MDPANPTLQMYLSKTPLTPGNIVTIQNQSEALVVEYVSGQSGSPGTLIVKVSVPEVADSSVQLMQFPRILLGEDLMFSELSGSIPVNQTFPRAPASMSVSTYHLR